MSITVDLCGGLGNQLFQIATVLCTAKKTGLRPYFPNLYMLPQAGNTDRRHTYYHILNISPDSLSSAPVPEKELIEISEQNGFRFQDIVLQPGKHYILKGYFQSYRYLQDLPELLRLSPTDMNRVQELLHPFPGKTRVSIHVRHGDYLRLQHFHNVLSLDYYRKAWELIQKPGEEYDVLLFSDDPEWCRKNFSWIPNARIIQETDYVELYLMSQCKHNIIANSSFSWWGAYLNKNPGKRVVYPSRWIQYNVDISDLIPAGWFRVEV